MSSGGQTLSMLSHSQEWAINPQGVQRGLTTGLVQMDEARRPRGRRAAPQRLPRRSPLTRAPLAARSAPPRT